MAKELLETPYLKSMKFQLRLDIKMKNTLVKSLKSTSDVHRMNTDFRFCRNDDSMTYWPLTKFHCRARAIYPTFNLQ